MQAQRKVEYQLRSQRNRTVAIFDDQSQIAAYLEKQVDKHKERAPVLNLFKVTITEELIND